MEPFIQTQALKKIYHTGDKACVAVNDVSITINKGDRIAITGPSGCGKTTLLHMLGGLLTPTSGTITVWGKNLFDYTPKEKARMRNSFFAYIMQNFALIEEDSVKKNLALPMLLSSVKRNRQEQDMRIEYALKLVNLTDKKNEQVSHLSGGQKQRVAIARAFLQDAEILLADEPTGALDSKMGDEIFQLLSHLALDYNKTLILVTHNDSLARQCDIVYQMMDGSIARKTERDT